MSENHGCPPYLYIRCVTLYPAAYPRPGKSESSLRPSGAVAYSLKMIDEMVDEET